MASERRTDGTGARRPWLGGVLLLGFAFALSGAPLARAAALAADQTAAALPADPVLRDVVRLLEAKLGEPLILRWLEESGRTPAPPTASDLVALKRAGASDELVAALLDRAKRAAPPVPSPAPGPSPPPASATPPPPSTAAAGTTVPVDVSLRYIHRPEEDEPWEFVVYLDGDPFPPLAATASEGSAPTTTERRQLAPGPHLLRWAQERHAANRRGRASHAARFDTERLSFTLAPGVPATIELDFRDLNGLILRFGGPIDARVAQGDRELVSVHTNNDPEKWPLLCEDVEANLRGDKPGLAERQELRSCVRWADLWKDTPSVPDRGTVRPAGR
jgi:hypothetical protein